MFRRSAWMATGAAAVCVVLANAACLGGQAPPSVEPRPVPQPSSQMDSIMVRLVAERLSDGDHAVRVDPRPLRTDDPDLTWVHEDDFVEADHPLSEHRRRVLRSLGIDTFDFPGDGCLEGGGGLPAMDAPLPPRPWPRCLLIGLPRPGGAFYPAEGIGSRGAESDPRRTVRVIDTSSEGMFVRDVTAAPTPDGGWEIVDVVDLYRVFS